MKAIAIGTGITTITYWSGLSEDYTMRRGRHRAQSSSLDTTQRTLLKFSGETLGKNAFHFEYYTLLSHGH